MKISYYAVLQNDEDGLWVKFPDLNGCFSCGDENNIEQMAKEAMELYLHGMEINNLPKPSSLSVIKTNENQRVIKITTFVELREERLYFPGIIEHIASHFKKKEL